MIESTILAAGTLLILSFLGGRLANFLGLPRVSGYLCAGLLAGPSVTGILNRITVTEDLHVLTEISLGIIAYSIGGSLEFSQIRHLGRKIGCITFFQAAGAAAVSTLMLLFFLPLLAGEVLEGYANATSAASIILGAISAATAPGAVMAIISELKIKNDFTALLLGVVALDDAVTIILFAGATGMAAQLLAPESISYLNLVTAPLLEVGISLTTGVFFGFLVKITSSYIQRRAELLMVIIGYILTITGTAHALHASPLLAAMTAGVAAANLRPEAHDCFSVLETIEETIFGLFFALAGAYMDISIIGNVWMLSIALLLFRMAGKHAGALIGAATCGAGEGAKKFLGLALFPQAGVTVGLILLSEGIFPAPLYSVLLNAVIGSVIINELIAPPLVKFAIENGGN